METGRLGSQIYGGGHPRAWGAGAGPRYLSGTPPHCPLQNPHRRQTLQVPTSWLRKGFHSALQPPGECPPAPCLPGPLQREPKPGWGWGEPWLAPDPSVLPTVSPAPAQQGQALQVSQLLPGLLGLRVPADPPLRPRHQARQGLLLQHVRAGLHLGECLGSSGDLFLSRGLSHLDSPHFADKETEAQRGEVTPRDHDEWQSQGFGSPVLFLAALGRASSLLAACSRLVSSRPRNTEGSGGGPGTLLSRARAGEGPSPLGKLQPPSWPREGAVARPRASSFQERPEQYQKGHLIQPSVPGWEFP